MSCSLRECIRAPFGIHNFRILHLRTTESRLGGNEAMGNLKQNMSSDLLFLGGWLYPTKDAPWPATEPGGRSEERNREERENWMAGASPKMDRKPEMDCPGARLPLLFSILGSLVSPQKSTPATILNEMGEGYQVNPRIDGGNPPNLWMHLLGFVLLVLRSSLAPANLAVENPKPRQQLAVLRRPVKRLTFVTAISSSGSGFPGSGGRYRLVAIRDDKTGKYHTSVTNVPPDLLVADAVASGHRASG